MTKKPFVVMVKPMGSACNMRCGYCYYLGTDQKIASPGEPSLKGGSLKKTHRMSDEVLEAFIRRYIADSPGPVVSFTWHGGEPTLAGLPFYQKAVRLQKKVLKDYPGLECWNSLQTNGLLLTDEWYAFLAKNRFDVGISIDGTRLCHDYYRKDASGAPTYERTVKVIENLKRHGIRPDLLCTVNRETAAHGREVYRALRDLQTGWMQFIPIIVRTDGETGVSPDSVTPEAYGDFLKEIFFEWVFHDLGRTEVQTFSETALALSGKAPNLCWMAPTCGNVLIVEKDGGIYSCDHFVDPAHRIGSVLSDDFQSLLSSDPQLSFGQSKKEALPETCLSCPYLPCCGGGCLKDRFLPANTDQGDGDHPLYYLCRGLKSYFGYAVPILNRILQLHGQKKPTKEVQSILIQEERAKYARVSRNDLCPCGSGLKFKYCCAKRVP